MRIYNARYIAMIETLVFFVLFYLSDRFVALRLLPISSLSTSIPVDISAEKFSAEYFSALALVSVAYGGLSVPRRVVDLYPRFLVTVLFGIGIPVMKFLWWAGRDETSPSIAHEVLGRIVNMPPSRLAGMWVGRRMYTVFSDIVFQLVFFTGMQQVLNILPLGLGVDFGSLDQIVPFVGSYVVLMFFLLLLGMSPENVEFEGPLSGWIEFCTDFVESRSSIDDIGTDSTDVGEVAGGGV